MSSNQQARYGNATTSHSRNYSGSGQHQPSAGFSYEAFHTPTVPSNPQTTATNLEEAPLKQEFSHDDGDVAMEDADPYNRMKYPSRPSHTQRPSQQYLSHEDSAAARRYSPMNTLSPTTPYVSSPQQPAHSNYSAYHSQNHSARQSPTRSNVYSTPSQQYYPMNCELFNPSRTSSVDGSRNIASRHHPLQLSPIQAGDQPTDQFYPSSATVQLNAVFGREVKSPRHPYPQHTGPKGPVPRFKKLKTVQDIEPSIRSQPAFRRANPEGGFISVRPLVGRFKVALTIL